MYRLMYYIVYSVSAQSSSAANPFAGLPPISSLPVVCLFNISNLHLIDMRVTQCNTECASVGQAQSSWNGDYVCDDALGNILISNINVVLPLHYFVCDLTHELLDLHSQLLPRTRNQYSCGPTATFPGHNYLPKCVPAVWEPYYNQRFVYPCQQPDFLR
jgi:hypothetical protein